VRDEAARWLAMADEDWEVARLVLTAGYRSACVFHVHLSLEKLLKALIIEATGDDTPPYSHNLPYLASRLRRQIPDNVSDLLSVLTSYGEDARYRTSSRYSSEFCAAMMLRAGEAITWLRQLLN
jgi:HEPN domain-containing protein